MVITDDPAEKLKPPLEYPNSNKRSGIPPHILKVGAIIMLIRNINLGSSLDNGACMVVPCLMENAVNLKVLTGLGRDNIVFIPRVKLTSTDPNMPFCISTLQFPLRLPFAVTINKSQDQTFRKIGIYLPKLVFING